MAMKKCSKCKTLKSLDEFGKNKAQKDGLHNQCKECARHTSRNNYKKNWEDRRAKANKTKSERKDALRQYLVDYLLTHPCEQCGATDIRVLEFDHIDPSTKSYDINRMIQECYGIETLQTEMNKCRVLCANCHAIHTSTQNKDYKHRYLSSIDAEEE